ncbi:MAG TPA: DUF1579 domain-containing protein [Bryobacteraceae bacterium]|nr:DUF1579 domain-containing protein [Bryobacteraceae bacterium]
MQNEAQAVKQEKVDQDCPMKATPQKEHEWLHQMVGDWTCEGEAMMSPDQPPVKWKATETVRSIGGMWVIGEGTGEMPAGGASQTVITLGYDTKSGRYVGSFVASMMGHMWVYQGQLDEGKTVLTLDTEGPGMTPDAPNAKYRDIVEIKSPDHRTLTSVVEGPDGQWIQIMSAVYRRR